MMILIIRPLKILKQKVSHLSWLFLLLTKLSIAGIPNQDTLNITDISQQLLLAAKLDEPTGALTEILKMMPRSSLKQLGTDEEKIAFWLNIYNAYTQIILKQNPGRYKKRSAFFKDKQIVISGHKMSLDDVEHGMLRRSKIKWSLGYFNKPFPGSFEKKNRVRKPDNRIHFALNCGAKSCPPIAFYKPVGIDKQLSLATKAYLKGEAEYDSLNNTVYLPAIMGWFRRDFGGKKEMIGLLQKMGILPANKKPAIKFKEYDWELFLENYQTI
ncbi:MAG: DUF547 domain-containing protein [Ferruginibacter sp.]